MSEHECYIGIVSKSEYSEMVTLKELREHIAEKVEYNTYLKENGLEHAVWLYRKVWSIKDYCDRRKRTDLTRFKFCPECGVRILWSELRRTTHE